MKIKGGFKKNMNGGSIGMSEIITILIGLISIAAICFIIYYFVFRKPAHKENPTPSNGPSKVAMMEHFEASDKIDLTPKDDETVVALYSASWCPHCQDYKPMWGKMKGSGVATTKSGKKVRFVDVDCSNEAHPSCKNYNVEGYPTVVAISASGHKQLSRPTTMEELEAAL
jgi:thiol-disulfide isomerase/thioredoxin